MSSADKQGPRKPPAVEARFELNEVKPFYSSKEKEKREQDFEKNAEQEELRHEREELEELIKTLTIPSEYRTDAQLKARNLKLHHERDRLYKVLEIFKNEGFERAVAVLEALNDPFVSDLFHDFLIMKRLHRRD